MVCHNLGMLVGLSAGGNVDSVAYELSELWQGSKGVRVIATESRISNINHILLNDAGISNTEDSKVF